MSASPPSGKPADWDVRLTPAAERAVRALEPVARRSVVRVLDGVGLTGPRVDDRPDPADPRARWVKQGAVRLRVVFSAESRVALVVGIEVRGVRAGTSAFGRAAGHLSDTCMDLRVALRGLVRAPSFSGAVVLTLAVGLGGSAAILGLVNTVHRSALPFEDGDRLVRLRNYAAAAAGERVYNMSPRDFHEIRRENRVFDGVVATTAGSFSLLGDDGATRVSAISVSEGWAALLGIRPVIGRVFTPEEEALGADAGVVLISHGIWDRAFGQARDVVGRTLPTAEGPKEVVGVLAPGFAYPYGAGVWTPGRFDPSAWQLHDLNVVARLAQGVGTEGARDDMARLYRSLREASPGTTPDAGVHVASLREDFIQGEGDAPRGLSAAVVLLLLLACANVANLLTIRLVGRERESTLRAVLGASRLRVARLAVAESFVLFLAGGLGGLALAVALAGSTATLIPQVLRTQLNMGSIRFDPMVVLATLGLSVAAGVGTGGVAALRASKRDLRGALREGGRGGGASRSTGRIQNALVVSEVAMALVLLVGAAVLFRHFQRLRSADLGYRTEGMVTLQVAVDTRRYATVEARGALLRQIEERVARLPEVAAVGITSVNPLCCGDWGAPIRIEGIDRADDAPPFLIHHGYATPSYFDAMGIPILRGRNFGAEDAPDAPPTVIVDEALAARFWPGQDPIGKRVGLDREGQPLRRVVGVVPHVYREGDYTEAWYLPLSQEPTGRSAEVVHLVIRQRSDGALQAARRAVAALDGSLATFGDATLPSLRAEAIGQDRVGAVLAGIFAGVGLLLACLGLYGLLAYRLALQTREIGTRLALGATGRGVVGLILARSVRLFGSGVALGVVLSVAMNRLLAELVPGVRMAPPGLVAGLALLLSAAALTAALGPAARAARLDPARTIQGG